MALVLSGERPVAAAHSLNPVRILARWIAAARAEATQRRALKSLLELDADRLDDLGINRGDLFDALHDDRRQTRLLAERRAIRLQR